MEMALTIDYVKPKLFRSHYKDHAKEFGNSISEEEYLSISRELYAYRYNYQVKVDSEGITRVYDVKTNTFGSYNPDNSIRTTFKPREGQAYFDRQPGKLITR